MSRGIALGRLRRLAVQMLLSAGAAALLLDWAAATAYGSEAAQDGIVLVTAEDITLSAGEAGTASAKITLLNATSAEPMVSFDPQTDGCELKSPTDALKLEALTQESFTLTLKAGCDIDQTKGQDVSVMLDEAEAFMVHLDPPAEASPNWAAVRTSYGYAALGSFVLLSGAWLIWPRWYTGASSWKKLNVPLPGLAASWKFTDSWASNATVLTAVFAGIFGSKDIVAIIVGEGASELVSIALVTAAVSLGLAGISPMLLQSLRKRVSTQIGDTKPGLYVTPGGLLVAALFTLTATAGQFGSLVYAVHGSDLWGDWAVAAAVAGFALLAIYAVVATRQNLSTGIKPPPPEEATIATTEIPLSMITGQAAAQEGAPEMTVPAVLVSQPVSSPAGLPGAIL